MKYPKISVIIPIYNTEQYLRKCIDSVINQTYTNLEIILVDDGSTDGSGAIVDEYVKRDVRIVVIHKKNGGVSNTKNVGLSIATGDYIGFVDSDDWIECTMYQVLVEAMKGSMLDIVICGYFWHEKGQQKKIENEQMVCNSVFGKQELLRYVFQRDSYKGVAAYSWNKLFRKEILEYQGQYKKFDESYQIGEDVLWIAQIGIRSTKIKYVDSALYHYMQRKDSAVHSQQLDKQVQRIEVYQKVIELFQTNMVKEDTIIYVKRFLAYHAMNIAKMAQEQDAKQIFRMMCSWMKKYEQEYKKTNVRYPERIKEFEYILKLENDI